MTIDDIEHADQLFRFFDPSRSPSTTEQPAERLRLLGGKGAGLVDMSAAGLPVPPGYVLSTEACGRYLSEGWSGDLERLVVAGMARLQATLGLSFGATEGPPLLVSVRSGAAVSMPGMMDTVLNVGMNDQVEQALAEASGDAAFAADTHRRALMSFADVVLGAPSEIIEQAAGGSVGPSEVRARLADSGFVVPSDPMLQLTAAVQAVFDSWNTDRARRYREIEGIDESLNTAATVQAMVFGNLGSDSGTGVAFSRHPSTGADGLMGDFLADAQGEDVVAGTHRTKPLATMADEWPELWQQLEQMAELLEQRHRDMVDIEFTVERGKLWLLQARRAKRSPLAAFRVAVAMASDPDFPLTRAEAVDRCVEYLDDPPHDASGAEAESGDEMVIATGLAAAPGRAIGVLAVDVDEAVRLEQQGIDVILARSETSPRDVHGMDAAVGLVTKLGGLVSHAAVVARSWGKAAVVGATELEIADDGVTGRTGLVTVGELVTVDGDNGRLLLGAHPLSGRLPQAVVTIKQWQAELASASDNPTPAPDSSTSPADAPGERAGPPKASRFAVLHALRIKGMATPDTIAAVAGVPVAAAGAGATLATLLGDGLVDHIEARGFWRLSEVGRTQHALLLASELQGVAVPLADYPAFLELNGQLKQICTDWQVRHDVPNDHEDDAYDQGVIARLVQANQSAQQLLDSASEDIGWLSHYQPRLTAAVERVTGGDHRAFTGVMCDSFHDIWMELHEDLILIQGIDRQAEGSF